MEILFFLICIFIANDYDNNLCVRYKWIKLNFAAYSSTIIVVLL